MSRPDAPPANPLAFWARASQAIEWVRRPRALLNAEDPRYASWFAGGMLNTSYNAIDLHVLAGRADQPALVFAGDRDEDVRAFTYSELQHEVSRLAGAFADLGVERGDCVVIQLPNGPEAVFAMLACARLGAVHAVVPVRLRANDLAQSLQALAPKLVLTATSRAEGSKTRPLKPVLDAAIEQASNKPDRVLVLPQGGDDMPPFSERDLDWRATVDAASPILPVALQAGEALYVLPVAEASGMPRAIVRDHGGHAVGLKWSVRHVFGLAPGEVAFSASDVDQFAGHAYGVYGPLLLGATSVIHTAGASAASHPEPLGRAVARQRVNTLWVSPAAIRGLQRADPEATRLRAHDLGALRDVVLTGARADPALVAWCERAFGAAVANPWSQTELGGPIAAPQPLAGCDVRVVDDTGTPVETGGSGHLTLALPLPPGALRGLWQNDAAYEAHYLTRFPGAYDTGDTGFIDADGGVVVTTRSADRIAIDGGWVGPQALEDECRALAGVDEVAVIGLGEPEAHDARVLVLVQPVAPDACVEDEVTALLCERLGPRVTTVAVPRLPLTTSGTLPRGTLRKLARGEPVRAPASLEDPSELDALRATLEARGFLGSER